MRDVAEMTLWFAASVAFMFVAAARRVDRRLVDAAAGGGDVSLSAFVLCALGPNAFSALVDEVLFTWPACLYLARTRRYSCILGGTKSHA